MIEQPSNIDSLEVKPGGKSYYLLGFIIWTAIILFGFIFPPARKGSTSYLFNNFTISKFLILVIILSFPTVCLYNYFNRKLELKVNDLGVWSKKTGLIHWQDLRHFHTKQVCGREEDIYYLIFKLKDGILNSHKEIKIELQRTDKDFDEIRNHISSHLFGYQIEDLGHKESYL